MLIVFEKLGGELNILRLDLTHPLVVGVTKYKTLGDEERKAEKARLREEKEAEGENEMKIEELWKPVGSTVAFFKAIQSEYAHCLPRQYSH